MKDGGNPALRHLLAVRQEINAAARAWPTSCAPRAAPSEAYPQEVLLGRQLDLATRVITARGARGGDQGGAGRFRHPCQPGAAARAAAGIPGAANLCDPAQEPDRRQRMERRGGDDLLGVRPPRAARTPAAAPTTARRRRLFVMGGGVKGGLHGAYPSLGDLTDGDLKQHRRLPQRLRDRQRKAAGASSATSAEAAATAGLFFELGTDLVAHDCRSANLPARQTRRGSRGTRATSASSGICVAVVASRSSGCSRRQGAAREALDLPGACVTAVIICVARSI